MSKSWNGCCGAQGLTTSVGGVAVGAEKNWHVVMFVWGFYFKDDFDKWVECFFIVAGVV